MALLELLLYDNDYLLCSTAGNNCSGAEGEFILYEDASSYDCCCPTGCTCTCESLNNLFNTASTLSVRIVIPCYSIDVTETMTLGSDLLNDCITWQTSIIAAMSAEFGIDVSLHIGCTDDQITVQFNAPSGWLNCQVTNLLRDVTTTCTDPFQYTARMGIQQGPGGACDGGCIGDNTIELTITP